MQTRKREEHMKVALMKEEDSMVMEEVPLTKRSGVSFKRSGISFKGPTQVMTEEHETGASGDYTVTLAHGDLNLVTDTGRWYLFAPQEWRSALPTQPTPGNFTDE